MLDSSRAFLRTLAAGAAFALLTPTVGTAAAEPVTPPASSPAGTFSGAAEVRIVEVPVQVVRGGQPVRGLTAADFQVWAGKEKQRIVGFEVVDVGRLASMSASAPVPAAGVPAAGRRHFLFLFDLSHSDPHSLERAQQSALRIARSSLAAADLAAVGVYSPTKGSRLVLGFTSDRAQIALAISTLGSTELIERRPDYLGLMLGQATDKMQAIGNAAEGPTRTNAAGEEGLSMPNAALQTATMVLNDMRILESMSERDLAAGQRDRVQRFTNALSDLALTLQQVQGRKHVILLSRGFDASLFTGQQEREVEGRQVESADEGMREIVRTDSDRRWGNSRLQGALRESLEDLRRADCVIHAIDISGAEVQGRAIAGEAYQVFDDRAITGRGSESLFVMAEETGGTFHQNFNDAGEAMKQVLESTAVTYVLTIQPESMDVKGGYVPLRVEVRGAPRGEVSARPGYFVGTPPGAQQGLYERLRLADLMMQGRPAGQIQGAMLGVALGAGAGACAMVEVDGGSLLTDHLGDLASAEVTVYAFDAQGAIRATARQLLGMDLQVVGTRLRATGFKLFVGLDLGAGEYQLRALVRNTVSGRFGIAVAPLTVPAGDGAGTLSGVFLEPPGRDWLLVRETGSARPLAYPFTLGERVVVPAAAPRLHADQPVTLWVEAPAGVAGLDAVVKRIDGGVAGGGPLQLGQRSPGAAAERLLATFSPAGLTPGGYTLEVRVAGTTGGTSSLPFTIE